MFKSLKAENVAEFERLSTEIVTIQEEIQLLFATITNQWGDAEHTKFEQLIERQSVTWGKRMALLD